ncbi:hypothetical protein I7I48_04617 [Histoplasma ohiense]|nr:hypothetical protein I7I48_04617 [Histoplasma ohiense (nom. inval.)]
MKQIKSEPADQQGSLWAVFARDTKIQLNLMFFILFIFIFFLSDKSDNAAGRSIHFYPGPMFCLKEQVARKTPKIQDTITITSMQAPVAEQMIHLNSRRNENYFSMDVLRSSNNPCIKSLYISDVYKIYSW